MKVRSLIMCVAGSAFSVLAPAIAFAQRQAPPDSVQHLATTPIYQVTIVSRTTKAINYGHRSEPTKVDFQGTPLLPRARGEATVESKRGSVLIDAKFEHVDPPTQFGPQFLTYVLWAISPEGRPQNLGELMLNSSNKGHLPAATQMQAFALIVTAEPYFSVSQPSDAVVMENVVRPDTIGKIEEVNAVYELLPRGEFTYEIGNQPAFGPAVSMSEYDSILAIYEAQSAIQTAIAAGAGEYAGDKLAKAQQLLQLAKSYDKSSSREIVSTAREATQTAEDSRLVAIARGRAEVAQK